MDSVDMLRQYIEDSDNIVFFGGAGVSTESGIPDFRSVDGLYHEKYDYPPETILSRSFFKKNPEAFYRFYRDKLVVKNAAPNPAHIRLAELETQGKLKAVITQNIDGLHQAAGSRNVIELHGTTQRCSCSKCGRQHDPALLEAGAAVPVCGYCGGVLQPDVVLYEDQLDSEAISSAIHYIRHADVLIIGGTSLVVYPAAGLVNYYRGNKLVLINRSATSQDSSAALVIREKIGEVFSRV